MNIHIRTSTILIQNASEAKKTELMQNQKLPQGITFITQLE
jgi:hypothetical protein